MKTYNYSIFGFCSLLFSLGIFFTSCQEIELKNREVAKPQPEGSKELNIIIDSSLDFSQYRAHTILDSAFNVV